MDVGRGPLSAPPALPRSPPLPAGCLLVVAAGGVVVSSVQPLRPLILLLHSLLAASRPAPSPSHRRQATQAEQASATAPLPSRPSRHRRGTYNAPRTRTPRRQHAGTHDDDHHADRGQELVCCSPRRGAQRTVGDVRKRSALVVVNGLVACRGAASAGRRERVVGSSSTRNRRWT